MPELVVDDVTKSIPRGPSRWTCCAAFPCRLAGGENLAVTGPSGCGKSTLLHIIGTLDTPTSRQRQARRRRSVSPSTSRGWPRFRNHQIGFVFQDHHLLPQCSVLENVLLPTLADGQPRAEAVERARMLLGPRRPGQPARSSCRPNSPAASGSGRPSPGRW